MQKKSKEIACQLFHSTRDLQRACGQRMRVGGALGNTSACRQLFHSPRDAQRACSQRLRWGGATPVASPLVVIIGDVAVLTTTNGSEHHPATSVDPPRPPSTPSARAGPRPKTPSSKHA